MLYSSYYKLQNLKKETKGNKNEESGEKMSILVYIARKKNANQKRPFYDQRIRRKNGSSNFPKCYFFFKF